MTPIDQGILYVVATALGVVLSRQAASSRSLRAVSFLNIWVALPGLFLIIYLARGLLVEDIGIALFGAVFSMIQLGLLAVATTKMASEARGSVVLNGSFVNAINLPFPLLQVLMGNYTYAATFATVTTVMQIVAAKMLQGYMKIGSGNGGWNTLARAAPLAAFGAGVVLHYAVWPAAATPAMVEGANDLLDALIAVIFVYFGVVLGRSFRLPNLRPTLTSRPFLTTALFRILVGPLVALVLALPLGEGSGAYLQMIFEATMPPAIANTVLARVYGFDEALSAKATGILTPINAVEAIGIFYLLRGL